MDGLHDLVGALRNSASQAAVRSWCYRQSDVKPILTKRSDDGTLIALVSKEKLDELVGRFNKRKRANRSVAKIEDAFHAPSDDFAMAMRDATIARARRKREAAEELEKDVLIATAQAETKWKRCCVDADEMFAVAVDAATSQCKEAAIAISNH